MNLKALNHLFNREPHRINKLYRCFQSLLYDSHFSLSRILGVNLSRKYMAVTKLSFSSSAEQHVRENLGKPMLSLSFNFSFCILCIKTTCEQAVQRKENILPRTIWFKECSASPTSQYSSLKFLGHQITKYNFCHLGHQ